VDPEHVSPPADADLDAIAADLAAVETALDELAAGTYRHDRTAPLTSPGTEPARTEPPAS
jgi:hypothetical protein